MISTRAPGTAASILDLVWSSDSTRISSEENRYPSEDAPALRDVHVSLLLHGLILAQAQAVARRSDSLAAPNHVPQTAAQEIHSVRPGRGGAGVRCQSAFVRRFSFAAS